VADEWNDGMNGGREREEHLESWRVGGVNYQSFSCRACKHSTYMSVNHWWLTLISAT